MQPMKRKAASWPFQVCDCHIWNHSPPTTMKPKNHSAKPQHEAGDGDVLRGVELGGEIRARVPQLQGAEHAKHAGEQFGGDDAGVGRVVQGGAGDGAPGERRVGEHGIHRHHVLHEGVVGAVVDDVVDADEQREQPDQQHQQDLRDAHDHGRPFEDSARRLCCPGPAAPTPLT